MDYKVNDYVRVTKLVGYDEDYGIEVGGVYQVVTVLTYDVRIKAPNGKLRLMHLHQIEKCDPPKRVRIVNPDRIDVIIHDIQKGEIYDVEKANDNGTVYIKTKRGDSYIMLGHQIEYVEVSETFDALVGAFGLDMGHGQVTEGKRMINTEETREVTQKHLNETLDRLKVKQSEYDIHINHLEQELEATRELKKKNSREMTHVTATLMIMEEAE